MPPDQRPLRRSPVFRNVIERGMVLSRGPFVEPAALPFLADSKTRSISVGGPHSLAAVQEAHIEAVLANVPTQDEAAAILNVDPSTLWRRKRRNGSGPGESKPARKTTRRKKSN
jgi:two-component system, NtrC family, response regulator AlgB